MSDREMLQVIDVNLAPHVKELAQIEAQAMFDDISGVVAVIVATVDGFDIASVVRSHVDPARIAALASSIAAIGEVVSTEARLGRCRSVIVDTESGFSVIFNVLRDDIALVINVIAGPEALVGQVNYRTTEAMRRLAK